MPRAIPYTKMKISPLELRRQMFHLLLGTAIAILVHFRIVGLNILLLALCAGFVISMLSKHYDIIFVSWFLKRFERPEAKFPGEGAFFLVAGSALALAVFPRNIALASIMILAFGDSFSHLFGKAYGKRKFAHKTLVGTAAGIISGFVGALLFVSPWLAFIGAGIAMLFEAFNLKVFGHKIDDNLFIPLASSAVMYAWTLLF